MANSEDKYTKTVVITKRLSVYPKILRPHKILELSNLDRQCPMLMYLVFFYKPSHIHNDSLSTDTVYSNLKSGLEDTLSVWYPAAGRLSMNPNDGKLNLWCNNEGAVLVEALTQVKILEIGDLSQYNEFLENLVYKPVFSGNFSDMPLVTAQVTKFGCGGYSIGIGTSHSLFDGPATYNFLSAWASNSTTTKERGGGHELHNPAHERGALLVTNSHAKKGKMMIRAAAVGHLYQLIQQAFAADHRQNPVRDDLGKIGDQNSFCVVKTFHLSGATIEKLKRKLLGESCGSSYSCSSFEVVTAHLWKARTKALQVNKDRMVCLQFAMDTRSKMLPPLPRGFSGNAYVLVSVALTARELEEASHEAIIKQIRQAKNSVNDDYVKAYVEALDASDQQGNLPPIVELTLVSDWTRTPFHKIDFLHGGKDAAAAAAYASPLVPPIPQVAYFMQNPVDSRGIDVRIGLVPQAINAFSHYFLMNVQ